MKVQWILIFLFVVTVGSGCSASQTMTQEPKILATMTTIDGSPILIPSSTPPGITPTMGGDTQLPSVSPTWGEGSNMTPYPPPFQALIEKAKADLASRLFRTVADIHVVEASAVTWPNSSLGCPQKGMQYAEVLTPGYLVVLEYAGRNYEYHAGQGLEVFFCINPTPPVPGTPGNT
jgi:hypothetical protein